MGLQFSRAVEDTEIWNAIGDGFSFVISSESSTSPGLHGKTGFSCYRETEKISSLASSIAAFFPWLLTLCVVSAGGAYLTSYQQCRKDAEDEIERNTKIQRELFQREFKIREIIRTSPTVAEMKNQLKQANSYYPEFSGFPNLLLQVFLAAHALLRTTPACRSTHFSK